MVKVAITGHSNEIRALYEVLREMPQVEIVGIIEQEGCFDWLNAQERPKLFCSADIDRLFSLPEIDVIINTASTPDDYRQRQKAKLPAVETVEIAPGNFIDMLMESKKELINVKKLKGELWAILHSVQDAIEVVDRHGLIKYVNPAFTRVTGIQDGDRVGKNIFDVSPHGALANSLLRQKPITGYRTRVGGSDVEVISNAAPIIIDGQVEGAVVVFQKVTEILKLMDELKESAAIIENLYDKIYQITGSRTYTFDDLVGNSKIFSAALETARKAAKNDSPVLISGESGTGKTMFAHALHYAGTRRAKPFIALDCAAIPPALLESELFGYEQGVFAGAVRAKLGKIELAAEGTLFIDNIHQLNPDLQEKLMHFLQTGQFRRIGGEKDLQSAPRIIASTACDIKALIRRRAFRQDLYFRLSAIELSLPPLRQRLEDIQPLVNALIRRLNRKLGKEVTGITPQALQLLVNYDWPGNISELERVIERAMAAVTGKLVDGEHLSLYIGRFSNAGGYQPLSEIIPLDKMEQIMLRRALAQFGESLEGKKKAAQALNISLATLYNKIKKYRVAID